MAKILILGASGNYAASLASVTVDTATSPELLALGTLGAYGINATTQKLALITQAAPTTFVAELVAFNQGNGTPLASVNIQPKNVISIKKQAYVAPVCQISFIGFNGASGSLALPTIVANDEAILLGIEYEVSDDLQMRNQENYTSGSLIAGQAAYDIMAKLALNINSREELTHVAFPVSNDTVATFTGTGTGLFLTKGSTTASFMIESATGLVASTGSIAAADIINVPSSNYRAFSFTALILGTGAGHTVVTLGGTQYVIADAGSAAQNATAVAAAINAGTQATAVVTSSVVVTITANVETYFARPTVTTSPDDTTWTQATLTVVDAETVPVKLRALAAVSGAASFELDTPYQGETGYFIEGTSATANVGVATTGTLWGLKLKVLTAGNVYGYATQLVIQNSTKTVSVGSSVGSGSYAQINALEKEGLAYRGQFDTVDRRMKYVPTFADATKSYTTYTILFSNRTEDKSGGHAGAYQESFTIAVPVGHSAIAGLELVLKSSNLFTNAALNF